MYAIVWRENQNTLVVERCCRTLDAAEEYLFYSQARGDAGIMKVNEVCSVGSRIRNERWDCQDPETWGYDLEP